MIWVFFHFFLHFCSTSLVKIEIIFENNSFTQKFSGKLCEMNCRAQNAIELCNCKPFFYPFIGKCCCLISSIPNIYKTSICCWKCVSMCTWSIKNCFQFQMHRNVKSMDIYVCIKILGRYGHYAVANVQQVVSTIHTLNKADQFVNGQLSKKFRLIRIYSHFFQWICNEAVVLIAYNQNNNYFLNLPGWI